MKKIVCFLLSLVFCLVSYAQSRDLGIADLGLGDKYNVSWEGSSNTGYRLVFENQEECTFYVKDIKKWCQAWQNVQKKTQEWVGVALDNRVTNLRKEIPADFPNIYITQMMSHKLNSAVTTKPKIFLVIEPRTHSDGITVSLVYREKTTGDYYLDSYMPNAYACITVYWRIRDTKQLQRIINLFNYDTIMNRIKNPNSSVDNLFK